jgi:SAM-dependent methyltransferase
VIYFHLSIHYGDWAVAAEEAFRALQPGGACVVWTLGPVHHRASMLARWFPSIGEIDSARFPDPGSVAQRFVDMGAEVSTGQEVERVERTAGSWAAAVRAGFVSTLQLIDAAELEAGLAAFAERHPDPAEWLEYELLWDWIEARKTSGAVGIEDFDAAGSASLADIGNQELG